MFEILTIVSVFAGFALVIVVLAKVGAGPDSLVGLYVHQDLPPRPRGVQEVDLPPFVFRDSAELGTSAA